MALAAESAAAVLITQQELAKRPHVEGVSIDPAGSHELDDAIHVERGRINRSLSRVQIHIANGGLLLGHACLGEARRRGWSVYYNDGTCDPMLEAEEAQGLSLDANHFGLGAPAVTTEFTFHHDTRQITDQTVYESRVSCENLTYRGFKRAVSRCNPQARAIARVARIIGVPPGKTRALGGNKLPQDVVKQYMLVANILKAQHMQAVGAPWLFRNHHLHVFDFMDSDALRQMYPHSDSFAERNMAWYAPTPTMHQGLSTGTYCHYTSPLRRFPDLVNHLNERAILLGNEIPYQEEELQTIAHELAIRALPTAGIELGITESA